MKPATGPLAPVAIFAYKRADKLRNLLDSLAKCDESSRTDFTIFIDGPKNELEAKEVRSVIAVAEEESRLGFVRIRRRQSNLGLSKSIIMGVSECLYSHDRVIVLEDDLVVSPYYLKFMNEALQLYENSEEVVSVHGFVYPTGQSLPETFFLRGADCWGWGTWRRGWEVFSPDAAALLSQIKNHPDKADFDFNGQYEFTRLLKNEVSGKVESWAVRWYASAFLAGKLTLYPGEPLVVNTGLDGSGTHRSRDSRFHVELSKGPVSLSWQLPQESTFARQAFEEFFRSTRRTFLDKVGRELSRIGSQIIYPNEKLGGTG